MEEPAIGQIYELTYIRYHDGHLRTNVHMVHLTGIDTTGERNHLEFRKAVGDAGQGHHFSVVNDADYFPVYHNSNQKLKNGDKLYRIYKLISSAL